MYVMTHLLHPMDVDFRHGPSQSVNRQKTIEPDDIPLAVNSYDTTSECAVKITRPS